MNYYKKTKGELSYSIAKRLLISPLNYSLWLCEPEQSTQALAFGKALDVLLLEPERAGEVVVEPKFDRRTSGGRAAYHVFSAENSGKIVVNEKDKAIIDSMLSSLRSPAHLHIASELDGTEKQLEFHYEIDGVPCKSRVDAYGNSTIYDLKTTCVIPTRDAWVRECWKYQYFLQAAFYFAACDSEMLPVDRFCWVIGEKSAPFHWVMYWVTRENKYVIAAEQKMLDAVATMKKCMETDTWPGLSSGPLYDEGT